MSSGSKAQIIGYRYYMGLHFGMAHGPVDALLEIEIGGRTAWSGSLTASGAIVIDKPSLFGGDRREGGIQGTLDVMFGRPTQGSNSYLSQVQGAPQPAYRGLVSAVFRRGLIAAMNPYIKPWAFKLRRVIQGWGDGGTAWYPEKATITLSNGEIGMNPAHIVYQCLTDEDWGMGHDAGLLDEAAFAAAADVFHSEGLGLCLAWSRQGSIESFLQLVMDHAGAVVGQDRATGKFLLKPIRAIDNPAALPLFDPSNVVSLESFQRASPVETTNEIALSYVDVTTGKTAGVTVQNLASIQAQGGIVAQSKSYPGLPTHDLAVRVAERDLQAVSTPLAKLRIKTNRDAYALLPGGAIRFSWPKLGLVEMVLRVLKVDYGDLQSGAIALDLAEDVYGMPGASYVAQQPALWVAPDTAAVAPTHHAAREASFRDLVIAAGHQVTEALDVASGFVFGMAARPSGVNLHLELWSRISPADYGRRGIGDWCPTGTLSADIGPTTTAFVLDNAIDLEAVPVGTLAYLGDELVRVDAITPSTGACTVARGCVDTVPKSHSQGARMWFYQDASADDPTEYVDGEVVDVKYVTVTTTEALALSGAPSDQVTIDRRHAKPYPPAKLRINGAAYPASDTSGSYSITWQHRDRLLQSDQIVPEGDGSIGPEPGTTYNVRIYDDENNLVRDINTSGTSHSYTPETNVSARYWRIVGLSVPAGDYFEVSEIQLLEGGVNVNGSATVTSSHTPTFPFSYLTDGQLNTRCYWSALVAEGADFWIKWDFGAGVNKAISGVKQGGYDTSARYMYAFTLQYSDDGANWTPLGSKSGLAYPGNFTLSSEYAFSGGTISPSYRVEVESVRDGVASHQAATHTWGTA